MYRLESANTPEHRQQNFEALELLARLARVDWKMWRQEVEALWPQEKIAWRDTFKTHKFNVGVELRFSPFDSIADRCEFVVMNYPINSPSNEYKNTLALMEQLLSERGIETTATLAAVPVRIDYCANHDEEEVAVSTQLFTILQLVITRNYFYNRDRGRGRGLSMGAPVDRFRIQQLKLEVPTEALNDTALMYMEEIKKQGVAICAVPELQEAWDDVSMLPIMQSIFATTASPLESNADAVMVDGVDHYVISNAIPVYQLSCLFSAIHASRSLRSISTRISVPQRFIRPYRERFWSWFAFAIFRRASTIPPIHQLRLDAVVLDIVDIDAMRRVVVAADPAAELFFDEDDTTTESVVANPASSSSHQNITASLFALVNPRPTKRWIQVTSWGLAWVHERDVAENPGEKAKQPPPSATSTVDTVQHLTIANMSESAMEPVLGFLEVVGKSVHQLCIEDVQATIPLDEWCRRIFQICPNLHALSMNYCTLYSVQVFVDCSVAGTCRLERLSLCDVLMTKHDNAPHNGSPHPVQLAPLFDAHDYRRTPYGDPPA